MKRFKSSLVGSAAIGTLVAAVVALPAQPVSAGADPAVRVDEQAGTVTMCGADYCAVVDTDNAAVVRSLTVDGGEVLDPALGMHSSVTTADGVVTSRELPDDPEVDIDDDTFDVASTPQQLPPPPRRACRRAPAPGPVGVDHTAHAAVCPGACEEK